MAPSDHFARALDQASSAQNRIAQAEVHRWYGQILMSHPEASARERARPHLADALARYHALGMPRHVDVTGALLAAASR